MIRATVRIHLKDGVLDPQGQAVAGALRGLGFSEVEGARQGKLIEIDLAETAPERARARVEEMCRSLLANPVIETYEIELAS